MAELDFHHILRAAWRDKRSNDEYLARCLGEPHGPEADELRTRARLLRDEGEIERAYDCNLRAARLFLPDGRGAAAGGAFHDLGEILTQRTEGSPWENQCEAERFFRLALECKPRSRHSEREAMTRSSLASCLRELAKEPRYLAEHRDRLLSQAREELKLALRLDNERGVPGLQSAARHLNTLINTYRQRGETGQVPAQVLELERKLGLLRQVIGLAQLYLPRLEGPPREAALHLLTSCFDDFQNDGKLWLNLGGALLELGTPEEVRRGQDILRGLIADAVPQPYLDQARLVLAGTLMELQHGRRVRAGRAAPDESREFLLQINEKNLDRKQITTLAEMRNEAGLSDAALTTLYRLIDDVRTDRMANLSDPASDEQAREIQEAAAQAARIHADRGEAVEAFLVLENAAGMRFEEQLLIHSYRMTHPVARVLWSYRNRIATFAGRLLEDATLLLHAPSDDVRAQILRAMREERPVPATWEEVLAQAPEEAPGWGASGLVPDWEQERAMVAAFRRVHRAGTGEADAILGLRQRSRELVERALALDPYIEQLDPEGFHQRKLLGSLLDPDSLRRLLRAHAGDVFLRLSWDEDLLVTAVFLDGEEEDMRGRTVRMPLPADVLARLDELGRLIGEGRPDAIAEGLLDGLTEGLARLDLTSVLPEGPVHRAILLPSFWASQLPLAALGPAGRTLLDRCHSLLTMPCLAPLRLRQVTSARRRGTLLCAPVRTQRDGATRLHGLAFAGSAQGEERLIGRAATIAEVGRRVLEVDVLSLYTHGKRGEGGVYVALRDGRLNDSMIDLRFAGMERVELWACESGVNQPSDPLTPPHVDEAFGLDAALVRSGVRSAIGTLWPVWELVTACLVWHHRHRMAEGLDAAAALSAAQRAFRDELLPALVAALSEAGPLYRRLQAFGERIGVGPEGLAALQEAAGPLTSLAAAGGASELDVRRLRLLLGHPTAWGAFRFIGVPEQRPAVSRDPAPEGPLTPEQQAEMRQVMARTGLLEWLPGGEVQGPGGAPAVEAADDEDPWPRLSALAPIGEYIGEAHRFDASWDCFLTEESRLAEGAAPGAKQAIQVARIFRDRVRAASADNLLSGLAWLHEALAAPEFTGADRGALSLEAAHLWLALAAGEDSGPQGWLLTAPDPVALARAAHLLSAAPLGADRAAAQAYLAYLRQVGRTSASDGGASGIDGIFGSYQRNLEHAANDALRELAPALDEPMQAGYADFRVMATACELAAACGREAARRWLKQITGRVKDLQSGSIRLVDLPAYSRFVLAWSALQQRDGAPVKPQPYSYMLPSREAVQEAWLDLGALNRRHDESEPARIKVLSNVLSRLELAMYGRPQVLSSELVASSGSLGAGYRRLLGTFLTGGIDEPPTAQAAVHRVGATNYLCDLRLQVMNQIVTSFGQFTRGDQAQGPPFWSLMYHRDRVLQSLSDAALLRPQGDWQRFDPFALSPDELEQAVRRAASPTGLGAWSLVDLCRRADGDGPARTAAFKAVRVADRIRTHLGEAWEDMRRRSKEAAGEVIPEPAYAEKLHEGLLSVFNPGMWIADWEQTLERMPVGTVVLALSEGPAGHVNATACWRGPAGPGQRNARSHPFVGTAVRGLLLDLHRPRREDMDHRRGRTAGRDEPLARVADLLAPVLGDALGPALSLRVPLRVGMLCPGGLRLLPLYGLRAGERPLLDATAALVHLPALGFAAGRTQPERPYTACLFAPCTAADGDTSFGEAAIRTLRRAFEPKVLDPPHLSGNTIVEVDAIAECAERVECLRLYGVGSMYSYNATTAALLLPSAGEQPRDLSARNLGVPMPRCATVELWACTMSPAEAESAIRDDRDHIPGLARAFLGCGAGGLLDLAWPIPDLVKALVCERFGVLRRRSLLDAGPALGEALRQTRTLLGVVRASAPADVSALLAALDAGRRELLRRHGLNPEHVAPFVRRAVAPSLEGLTAAQFAEEISQPVHLAAFRYFGAILDAR